MPLNTESLRELIEKVGPGELVSKVNDYITNGEGKGINRPPINESEALGWVTEETHPAPYHLDALHRIATDERHPAPIYQRPSFREGDWGSYDDGHSG